MKRAALLLVAACGTETDIPQPDGPFVPGPVSIEITQRGQPAVNVEVIFQNADSSVALATVTDFDGKATAEIDGDGFVTVIEPREAGATRELLSTFAGVQGGDTLHLDLARPEALDVAVFGLKLQEDTMTVPSGGYHLYTQCGPVEGGGSLVDITPITLIGCGEAADMLVVSLDEFGLPARGQFRSGLDVTIDHDFSATPGVYEPFVPATLAYENIPAEIEFVGAYRAIATDDHRVIFDQTAGVLRAESSVEIRVPFEGGSIVIHSANTVPVAGEVGAQTITEWGPASNESYTLDLGAAMLPRFTEPPVFDLARRTIGWAEAPAETEPDATRIHLVIDRPEIPTSTAWEWRLIGPRTGASLTLPRLPIEDRFDFNPADNDIITVRTLTTAKLPDGFDKAVREHGFEPFDDMRVGASGRIVRQDLAEPEPIGEPEL